MVKVAIFCESGKTYGMGHLSRCKILQEKLQVLGAYVVLYNFEEGDLETQSWFYEDNILTYLHGFYLAIIDSYHATYQVYEMALRAVKLVLIIDDIARIDFPPKSIILNGGIQSKRLYSKHFGPVYAGLEYMIYNKVFLQKKVVNQKLQKILVCFGGSDAQNYTQKVLDLLKKEQKEVIVVLGTYYTYTLQTHSKIFKNIDSKQMAGLFSSVDLAILAGGRMVNEAILSQVPTLVLPIAHNQEYQVKLYDAMQVVKKITLQSLLQSLRDCDFVMRKSMRDACSKIKIGNALDNFLLQLIKETNGKSF